MNKYIIVFDTNVWLDLYELPNKVITTLIDSFEKSNLFWMPKQVAIEFLRNNERIRSNVQGKYSKNLDIVLEKLEESIKELDKAKDNYRTKGIYNINDLWADIYNKIAPLKADIEESVKEFKKSNRTDKNCISKGNDPIEKFILSIDNEIGFDTFDLIKLYLEGEIRFKYKIPPGYKDSSKDNIENRKNVEMDSIQNLKEWKKVLGGIGTGEFEVVALKKNNHIKLDDEKKYGDLIIWKEILNKIASDERDIIFVTNELKPDWWENSKDEGKKIHNLLEQEFKKYSKNKNTKFNMLSFENFLERYKSDIKIPDSSIDSLNKLISVYGEIKEYFFKNKERILEEKILEEYLDDERMEIELYEFFFNIEICGGDLSEIREITMENIQILDFKVKDYNIFNGISYSVDIVSDIEIDVITVNNYIVNSGFSKNKMTFTLEFVCKIEDFDFVLEIYESCYNLEEFMEFTDILIKNIDIQYNIAENYEFYDVNVDEDMFRDR